MTSSADAGEAKASEEDDNVKVTHPDRLVWISVATTSSDLAEASLLEVSLAVTDNDLTILAQSPEVVLAADERVLASMDAATRARHERTGLLSRMSEVGVSLDEAQAKLLELLETHCEAGKTPLCGHEVWKARGVLRRLMPKIVDQVHYRLVELTTIEALAERWYPDGPAPLDHEIEESPLRCADDVRRTIERVRAYRAQVMAASPASGAPAPEGA